MMDQDCFDLALKFVKDARQILSDDTAKAFAEECGQRIQDAIEDFLREKGLE